LGLATIFYCLRFETFLFVASYDSQGHGGDIRPCLHTGIVASSKSKSHCDWRSVSQSVSLGVERPSVAHDQRFIAVWQLQSCYCGAPSLTRGQVCLLYMLLALASAFFLGSKSLGSRGRILLSQIWDFLSVTSYDSQGHGGGIRPHLHTDCKLFVASSKSKSKSHCDWRSVSQSVSLGVEPHLGPMTRYLFLSDSYVLVSVGHPLWREYWSVRYLKRHYLAMAVVHFPISWPLPSNGSVCHNTKTLNLTDQQRTL
jgi:hypothetical protein